MPPGPPSSTARASPRGPRSRPARRGRWRRGRGPRAGERSRARAKGRGAPRPPRRAPPPGPRRRRPRRRGASRRRRARCGERGPAAASARSTGPATSPEGETSTCGRAARRSTVSRPREGRVPGPRGEDETLLVEPAAGQRRGQLALPQPRHGVDASPRQELGRRAAVDGPHREVEVGARPRAAGGSRRGRRVSATLAVMPKERRRPSRVGSKPRPIAVRAWASARGDVGPHRLGPRGGAHAAGSALEERVAHGGPQPRQRVRGGGAATAPGARRRGPMWRSAQTASNTTRRLRSSRWGGAGTEPAPRPSFASCMTGTNSLHWTGGRVAASSGRRQRAPSGAAPREGPPCTSSSPAPRAIWAPASPPHLLDRGHVVTGLVRPPRLGAPGGRGGRGPARRPRGPRRARGGRRRRGPHRLRSRRGVRPSRGPRSARGGGRHAGGAAGHRPPRDPDLRRGGCWATPGRVPRPRLRPSAPTSPARVRGHLEERVRAGTDGVALSALRLPVLVHGAAGSPFLPLLMTAARARRRESARGRRREPAVGRPRGRRGPSLRAGARPGRGRPGLERRRRGGDGTGARGGGGRGRGRRAHSPPPRWRSWVRPRTPSWRCCCR